MRLLTAIFVILALIWGGYWFIGSRAVEKGVVGGLAGLQGDGWHVDYGDLSVRGFPNRFDLTLDTPDIVAPDGSWRWQAPFFQLFALSYKPNHLIAVWPNEQSLSLPGEILTLATQKMQASVVFAASTDLVLDRSTLVVEAPQLSSDLGWALAAEQLRLATRPADGAEAKGALAHELGAQIVRLAPDPGLLALLDPALQLPPVIEDVQFDAVLSLDAPLDRHSLQQDPPGVTALDLRNLRIAWGDMRIEAEGRLTADAEGYGSGTITLTIRNWQGALAVATAAGLILPEVAPTWANAFEALSDQAGTPGTVVLPIDFARGRASYGLFPLGYAPRLR